jgi:tetratricopeptide (TPR) repeat protein
LLAGFYFRVDNFEKSKEIIKTKLPNQFDKKTIINEFSNENNIFNKIQKINVILASKIYNLINENNSKINKSYSYQKILLEFSVFLEPKMDISKYALAEIYNFEKTFKTAFKILDTIPEKSFFSLAANLKQLAIKKSSGMDIEYKTLLFKILNIWPDNKLVLYRLASYYKSKSQYRKSLKIYKKILDHYNSNDRDLFLYAANLDKIGKWKESRVLFLELLKKNPQDTYTLNYVSYKLALKNQELELALDLIKKALVLDPNNGYFLDTLGWVEYKRKNFKSAVYFLEKSVSILPKSAEVINHLGDCYFMLNRKKEAIFEWNKALKYETDKNIIKKIKEKIRKHEHVL